MREFQSLFPWNQELIATYPLLSEKELEERVSASALAFTQWKNKSFFRRGDILKNIAALLRRDEEALATLISREMGKVIAESRAEIEKCAWVCEYYAEHAGGFLQDEIQEAGYRKSLISYQPIGTVLAIMPDRKSVV